MKKPLRQPVVELKEYPTFCFMWATIVKTVESTRGVVALPFPVVRESDARPGAEVATIVTRKG